jgi:formylglycine-generating enzyme required for sulfatase activity
LNGNLGCCLIFIPFGDWFIDVSGHVVDPNLDPIEGVTVSLFIDDSSRPASRETTLDKSKYWVHGSGAPPGLFRRKPILLVVEKEGFQRFSAALNDRQPPPDGFLIKLQPISQAKWKKEAADKKAHFRYAAPKLKLVWCPPGKFPMGSPRGENDRRSDEGPIEVILTTGFWLGRTEVTQRQWKCVMGTTPWSRKSDGGKEGDDFPATWVDYDDATKFCLTLTTEERRERRLPSDWEYKLPTEAQWEYAARAGAPTRFSFGDSETAMGQYAWFAQNANEPYAHQVGLKKPNAWGLYDVQGNVSEWCRDWYVEALPGGNDPESKVPPRRYRVNRGGSWYDVASLCRLPFRSIAEPDFRHGGLGFRVARIPVAPVTDKSEAENRGPMLRTSENSVR